MVLEYGLRLHVHSLSIHPPPSPPGPAAGVKSLLATTSWQPPFLLLPAFVMRSPQLPGAGARCCRHAGHAVGSAR